MPALPGLPSPFLDPLLSPFLRPAFGFEQAAGRGRRRFARRFRRRAGGNGCWFWRGGVCLNARQRRGRSSFRSEQFRGRVEGGGGLVRRSGKGRVGEEGRSRWAADPLKK